MKAVNVINWASYYNSVFLDYFEQLMASMTYSNPSQQIYCLTLCYETP